MIDYEIQNFLAMGGKLEYLDNTNSFQYGGNLFDNGGEYYTYAGRPEAKYQKVNNKWQIDLGKGYVPMTENYAERAKLLDAQAMKHITPQTALSMLTPPNFRSADQKIKQSSLVPTAQNAAQLKLLYAQKAEEDFKKTPLGYSKVLAEGQRATILENKAKVAAQQNFEKEQWNEYNKMSWGEKALDRTRGFMVDPLGMTSRAITGEQGYIPGIGRGLLNRDSPEYLNYLKATGQTPGKFEVGDLQNMLNPMYWGASAGNQLNQGNYTQGLLELGLSLSPVKGIGSNVKSGAKYLADDFSNIGKAINTSKQTGFLSRAHEINPWAFKANPEAHYRMLGDKGYADAIKTGIIKPAPIETSTNWTMLNNPKNASKTWFNKGIPINERYDPNTFMGYKGPDFVEYKGKNIIEIEGKRNRTYSYTEAKDNLKTIDPEIAFYREHWLQGAKKLPKTFVDSKLLYPKPAVSTQSITNRRLKELFKTNIPLKLSTSTGFKYGGQLNEEIYLSQQEIDYILQNNGKIEYLD